jgi:hypothetical protein
MEKKNKNKRKSSPELMSSVAWCTSREKAIPGTPKWLIPDAFWFASDLYAGGNAYRWRILQFAGDNFFTAGAFGMCAGDNILSLTNL